MASKQETDAAIVALRNGQASRDQEEIARRAAQNAGSVGNDARAAFQNRK